MQIISLILLDSDLTRGWYYPTFEHLGLSWVTQVLVLTTSRSNGLRAWGASERTAEIEPYSFWMQISNYDILSTKSSSHLPSTCSEHREQTMSQAVAYKRLKTMDNYKTVTPTVAEPYERWSFTRIFNYKAFCILACRRLKGFALTRKENLVPQWNWKQNIRL